MILYTFNASKSTQKIYLHKGSRIMSVYAKNKFKNAYCTIYFYSNVNIICSRFGKMNCKWGYFVIDINLYEIPMNFLIVCKVECEVT